jgi:hypothetical protein
MITNIDPFIVIIVLFLFIYICSDSFFAEFLLFWISIVETLNFIINISTQIDSTFTILMASISLYALASMITWIVEYQKEKNKV